MDSSNVFVDGPHPCSILPWKNHNIIGSKQSILYIYIEITIAFFDRGVVLREKRRRVASRRMLANTSSSNYKGRNHGRELNLFRGTGSETIFNFSERFV